MKASMQEKLKMRKFQNDATSKQTDQIEIYLTINDRIFFNICPLLIATIIYTNVTVYVTINVTIYTLPECYVRLTRHPRVKYISLVL